jgi:hypothetical protein
VPTDRAEVRQPERVWEKLLVVPVWVITLILFGVVDNIAFRLLLGTALAAVGTVGIWSATKGALRLVSISGLVVAGALYALPNAARDGALLALAVALLLIGLFACVMVVVLWSPKNVSSDAGPS